jgi:hypothetical protein
MLSIPDMPESVLGTLDDLRRPGDSCVIWRYVNIYEFLTLVTDRRLMFRQFKDLQTSDKLEGMVPSGFWESWECHMRQETKDEAVIAKARTESEKHIDDLRCFSYASCWNMAKAESALMWMAYAPKGLAIKSTVKKLRTAKIQNTREISGISCDKILYADDWSELADRGINHEGIVLARLFLHTKRKLFSPEKEVRFRVQPVAKFERDGITGTVTANSQKCPPWSGVMFENLEWIDAIVADSAIAPWGIETLSRLIETHGIKFRQSGR